MSQDKIKDILGKYGEPVEGNVWAVQGQRVILHKALERIAACAGIWFDDPVVLRAERDEAVIMVKGYMGPDGKATPWVKQRVEWSIGEALVNVNYRVSGKQAGYVYAMAEKRAKDRVILKLLELHGYAYSEDEADDFRDGKPRIVEREREPFSEIREDEPELGSISVNGEQVLPAGEPMSAYAARKSGVWTPLVTSLRACKTRAELEAWNDEHREAIYDLPDHWRAELRDEYKACVEHVVRGR